jgi:hypothetical protein
MNEASSTEPERGLICECCGHIFRSIDELLQAMGEREKRRAQWLEDDKRKAALEGKA